MKKFTALAGVLLLSSSLVAGCTQGAAPGNRGATPNNTSRVQDIGNRMGVRNITPNTNPGTVNNYGTTTANNLRQNRTLEARVETIPGIRNARVLVVGNTAYVAINQGTNANARTGATSYGVNRDRNLNNAVGGTYRGGTTAGTYGAGAYAPGTFGTAGTYGAGTYGTGLYGNTMGTGTTGTNAIGNYGATGTNAYSTSPYGGIGTARTAGTYGTNNLGGVQGGATYAQDTNRQGYGNYYNAGNRTYGTAGTTGNTGVVGNYGPAGAGTKYGATGTTGAGTAGTAGTTGITGTTGTAGMTGTTGLGTTYGVTGRTGVGATGGAATYGTTTDVTSDVKARVTAAIKQADPSIQNVYVSANPALLNRMNAFVTDTAAGHPLRGTNDLLDTLRRMFPTTTTR